ncbi:PepSY domain-containing protein [Microbulbifer sp. SA54]|uniref:PepSY domain-containing protein n=1 Tax=Microbulbifer sp. SA54 TaxID=3401577 RepID=UPI003AB02326
MKLTGAIIFVVALLLSLTPPPSQAAAERAYDVPYRAGLEHSAAPHRAIRVQQKGISRDEAASIVKRRYGGKILAIKEIQKNGKSMYRVKGLSDKSQVYVVYVDKQSGSISR